VCHPCQRNAMKLKRIEDQVVVVCGASSGMGREAAIEFAKAGAKVVASARSQEGLSSLCVEIGHFGGEVFATVADVSDYDQVKSIAQKAIDIYGRIDTWVQFAGTALYAPFRETTPEEFKRIVDVNLLGAAYAAMVALPHLSKQGGALIEISSVEAEVGTPYLSAYAASKHGVKGFLDVLRMELKHENVPVSVTNIMPSGINTPFFNHARTKLGVKPMPVRPVYQPETVVHAVLHAAQHPTEDLIVGGGGSFFVWAKRVMPRVTEAFLLRTGFKGQRTAEPKQAQTPDEGLFQPGTADTRIHGDFDSTSRSTSTYTWLQMHRGIKRTLSGALLAGAATALVLSQKRER